MSTKDSNEQYGEAEAARRRDAIIRNMIATPPKKHEPLKVAKKRRTKRISRSKG